jgi:hypothetical protein
MQRKKQVASMIERTHSYDVVADFWQWYQRRQMPQYNPVASLALDKCEDALAKCDWDAFLLAPDLSP